MVRPIGLVLAVLLFATPAFADGGTGERPVNQAVDGAITAGAMAVAVVPMVLRPRDHRLWDTQLLGELDHAVYDQWAPGAAGLSDALLLATIAAPAAYLTGPTIDDADGDRLVIYGETLAVDLALAQLAKYVVQRPRPYLYNHSAEAARYAQAAGDDGWASFYSSHAAMSFGAAVAGAYLLSASNGSPLARAFAWGGGLAAAAATSNLRVRAGRHFYSDVILGGIIGTAVGYGVPALHAQGKPYALTGNDVVAAGAGLFAGTMISELIPLHDSAHSDRSARAPAVVLDQVHVGPLALRDGGGGLSISGRVRSRSWGRVALSKQRPGAGDTE